MKFSQVAVIILISFVTASVTVLFRHSDTANNIVSSHPQETSYERVVRTGILHCGYEYWDGGTMKDEKTGKVYGPWVDILEAIGKATGLKIEWTSQVGWSDVGAALKSNKIDAMCAGMWTSAAKSKEINFSVPLAYQAIEAFVRNDDHRFDNMLDRINENETKIAVIENDNSDFIAKQDFPRAQKISLGSINGSDSELLMHVLTNKADVTFTVTGLWRDFDKANPGKIRRLSPDHKLRVFGLAIAVNNDDPRLLQIINSGGQELENSAVLDKILDQANEKWPDMYIKPLKPYP